MYPDAEGTQLFTLSADAIPHLTQQLGHLGFSKNQIQDATIFLSETSTLTSNLLSSLSPLEACIEYLVLHLPECDLPQRFLPTNNSSNPFITSTHSGHDDLKKRWIEEKAVKEAGWPMHAVQQCTANPRFLQSWDLLIVALSQKLIGRQVDDDITEDVGSPYQIDVDEYEAFGAQIEEPGHLVLPLFSAPIIIHILFSDTRRYPRPGYLPIFITSTTVPAYVRLHLLSRFLREMESKPELDAGEGFCMTLMRILEGEWAMIEDNGPPDMSIVLKDLIPSPQRFIPIAEDKGDDTLSSPSKPNRKGWTGNRWVGNDAEIKRAFETVVQNEKVSYFSAVRQAKKTNVFDSTYRCWRKEGNFLLSRRKTTSWINWKRIELSLSLEKQVAEKQHNVGLCMVILYQHSLVNAKQCPSLS